MTTLAILLAGYSLFCALSIAASLLTGNALRERADARAMGVVLLAALAGLQLVHLSPLRSGPDWTGTAAYRVALFAVAPAFHLFSRAVLQPLAPAARGWRLALHALPLPIAPWLPPAVAQPAAFLIGAGYLLWLGRELFALRAARAHFRAEIALLGTALALAAGVAVIALTPSLLARDSFIALYACAIGLAFLLVQTALARRPDLPAEVQEAAQTQAAYAHSTLGRVDCDDALARLAALMDAERLFVDPELSLPALAQRLDLSTHQLSELLNARLGKGFTRYLRERRVAAARTMLVGEPTASVLSVGLNAGFNSQSTFYEAFREIEGMTPGQYRTLHGQPPGAMGDSAAI